MAGFIKGTGNMVNIETIRQIALSFSETYEQQHFEKTSFRVAKKIFATYDSGSNQVCVKLSLVDQDVFCLYDKKIIFPVPNKWGKQGWTFIRTDEVPPDMLVDALTAAYCEIAPQKLCEQLRPKP